ncbi:MAG: FixH family protein [Paracoccaceae bacterium]|nr:FixH family protein [Paracoccaceae bacterium]
MSEREITGRQVFFFTAGAFSIIIAVNLLLATKAVTTFPGLEVKNSYVASQSFEERRDAQEELGWTTDVAYADGALTLAFADQAGQPVAPKTLSLLIGRKTNSTFDQRPDMALADGVYTAALDLDPGFWTIRLKAESADGTLFEKRLEVSVPR